MHNMTSGTTFMSSCGDPPCMLCGVYHTNYPCPGSLRTNYPLGIEDTSMWWTTQQSFYPGFQTCPVCKGTGSVFDDLLPTRKNRCTVCKGEKIINVLSGRPPQRQKRPRNSGPK